MTRDPFKLTGPTCLSFSGGSTSGYMLWRTLQANTPEDIGRWLIVCFANTGREAEQTLVFVRECAQRWAIAIVWLEWRDSEEGFARVDFDTASRDGEPFEALIRKRNYLPNPVTRFCTSELKIRTMHRYLRTLGWHDMEDGWDQFIGIRADEPVRVSKIRARGRSTESSKETMCMPLAEEGVSYQKVDAFWAQQPFKLELVRYNGRTLEGNCDYCFLKPPAQRLSLARAEPAPRPRLTWWARIERDAVKTIAPRMVESGFLDERGEPLLVEARGDGAIFCKDGPTYSQIAVYADRQDEMFDHDQEALACYCGD
ncbi:MULTISPECIES: Nin-like protein [Variovorax]|uniref:Nin-like protein n=1 Tax=Variovorax TaxID=34072 RepID=UPI00285E5B1C|nr:Nin-like protein [Variovorax sp. 3319]MDR6887856.1 3'-phosphoadenosine 5'-phosphosulfate sulfotransferase (PAPS reductase)/FAD synthetase [Variovorax sp. 3319]